MKNIKMKNIKIKNIIYIMKDNDKNELLAEIQDWYSKLEIYIIDKENHLKILNYIIENELLKKIDK